MLSIKTSIDVCLLYMLVYYIVIWFVDMTEPALLHRTCLPGAIPSGAGTVLFHSESTLSTAVKAFQDAAQKGNC